MPCSECHNENTEVHITVVKNKEMKTLSLCAYCAEKLGFNSPLEEGAFPLSKIVSQLSNDDKPVADEFVNSLPDLTCSNCGMTYAEFTRHGRIGCGQCYQAFKERLMKIMEKIHGSAQHIGRMPQDEPAYKDHIQTEERLEQELREAVLNEDYEKAAQIRDQLQEFRGNEMLI